MSPEKMDPVTIFGWIILSAGTVLWLYGYVVTGYPSLVDWPVRTPWWIADFLPNIEAEIGMALANLSIVPIYWRAFAR